VGGDHDDGDRRIVGRHPLQKAHAVHVGHLEVRDDHVDVITGQNLEGLTAVRGGEYLVAFLFQHGPEDHLHVDFIVDNQNPIHAITMTILYNQP